VVGNTHSTCVKRVASSFQEILRDLKEGKNALFEPRIQTRKKIEAEYQLLYIKLILLLDKYPSLPLDFANFPILVVIISKTDRLLGSNIIFWNSLNSGILIHFPAWPSLFDFSQR